jgi:hypothetical protein
MESTQDRLGRNLVIIKAFAAYRADQSLTERVRLGSLEGRLQYLQIHRLQSGIKLR